MVELKDLQRGQNLRIKTASSEIIIGKFKKLSVDGERVEIAEPKRDDGTPLGKMMYINVYDIKHLKSEAVEGDVKKDDNQEIFSITQSQRSRIQKMIEGTMYINQADRIYHEALTEIAEHFEIGVHAENTDKGRISKASFLQIATATKLYVFNLMHLDAKRLFNDLRPVLESNAYRKIIFDSRLLLDNLSVDYKLKVSPVCDLTVIFSLERDKEIKNLNECTEEILGIDTNIELKNKFLMRPTAEDIKALGSKVAYLLPLYSQLNQLKIMDKYADAIDEYLQISNDSVGNELTSVENIKLKEIIKKNKADGGELSLDS